MTDDTIFHIFYTISHLSYVGQTDGQGMEINSIYILNVHKKLK
jgi:hypothetical protein